MSPTNPAYLHEAQAFSSFLLTHPIAEPQNDEAGFDGELPDILRSTLPPRGVIGIKLDGIKHCRELAKDFLAMLDDDNSEAVSAATGILLGAGIGVLVSAKPPFCGLIVRKNTNARPSLLYRFS